MSLYIVTRKSDGAEVYRYQADQPIEWQGFEFATHEHVLAPPEPGPAPAPVEPHRITKLAFRNRFTQAEKAAIELASLDNPSAPMAQRAQAAGLRATMKDQEVATYIDLSRADTRAGVMTLEAAGLLAAGRAAVILDTAPTEQEVWRG